MGFRVEISAFGDKLISRELLDVGDRATDARPAFEAIADDLRGAESRRFRTNGNGTWAPLAPSTRFRKLSAGQGRVLVATGALRRSLTVKGAPDHTEIVAPRFLVFGTTVPYARFHQTGTRFMPARKPLGFTEATRRKAVRTLQSYIVKGEV